MTPSRRHALTRAIQTLGLALVLAHTGLPVAAAYEPDDDDGFRTGHVFTSTNAVAGNELLVFAGAPGAALTLQARLATNGTGTGTGLGNQGAVTLSGNGRFVFVVNPASNSVTTFAVRRSGLVLRSTIDSGGLRPISVTEHHGVVYVLNANGAGNVAGFRNADGELLPIANSAQPLSAAGGTGAAQVGFSPDGDTLLVTEKATNQLTSYPVDASGRAGAPIVSRSNGMTPFGFAFDRRGRALVSEAFGGAANASAVSSYAFDDSAPARPALVSASIGTTQTAACWVVVTPNGRHAYVTNTGSGTISRYAVRAKTGQLALGQGVAATAGAGPIDAAIAGDGRRLFVLNSGSHTIGAYAIANDGTLAPNGSAVGLPVGANGLAAN